MFMFTNLASTNSGVLQIVADGSEKVNDPISDQDYFKVVGDVLTYRSKTEGSPRWRVRFQVCGFRA